MPDSRPSRTMTSAIAVIVLLSSIWLLQDFWTGIAWAAILAVIFWPISRRFAGRWRLVGPALSTLFAASLVILPLTFLIVEITKGFEILLPWVRKEISKSWPFPSTLRAMLPKTLLRPATHAWDSVRHALAGVVPGIPVPILHKIAAHSAHLPSSWLSSGEALLHHGGLVLTILGGAEDSLINAGIALLVLYALLSNGESVQSGFSARIQRYFGDSFWQILSHGVRILRGTFISIVATALFEAFSFWIVYALAGVPHPILWATLSGLFSIVPFGASLAFTVVSLWLWLAQGAWIAALIVFLVGYGITAFADNILKPLLIGGSARMPFVLIFLGLLGGLSMLGILGVFIGPMMMGMAQAWWISLIPEAKK